MDFDIMYDMVMDSVEEKPERMRTIARSALESSIKFIARSNNIKFIDIIMAVDAVQASALSASDMKAVFDGAGQSLNEIYEMELSEVDLQLLDVVQAGAASCSFILYDRKTDFELLLEALLRIFERWDEDTQKNKLSILRVMSNGEEARDQGGLFLGV